MSRREKIEAMLKDQPADTFLRYALALEWEKEDEYEKSLDLFEELMKDDPPYVPAFFMAGQLLSKIDRSEEAKPIITQGISHAEQQGDAHAAAEMKSFLEMLDL